MLFFILLRDQDFKRCLGKDQMTERPVGSPRTHDMLHFVLVVNLRVWIEEYVRGGKNTSPDHVRAGPHQVCDEARIATTPWVFTCLPLAGSEVLQTRRVVGISRVGLRPAGKTHMLKNLCVNRNIESARCLTGYNFVRSLSKCTVTRAGAACVRA